jgi:hypothetical protein
LISCILQINTIGSGSTTSVSGLPFPAANITALAVGLWTGLANSYASLSAYANASAITFSGNQTPGTAQINGTAALGNGSFLSISGAYIST